MCFFDYLLLLSNVIDIRVDLCIRTAVQRYDTVLSFCSLICQPAVPGPRMMFVT